MSLMEAKQMIWDEIIAEMRSNWEYFMIVNEKKVTVRECRAQLEAGREARARNSLISRKYIQFVNERPAGGLRTIDIVDQSSTVMEVMRMLQKEDARVKAEECLKLVVKGIEAFKC